MAGHQQNPRPKGLIPGPIRLLLAAAPAVLVAIAGYAGFVEPYRVTLEEIEIPLRDLPAALDGLKVLHVSDLESSGPGRREALVASLGGDAGQDIVVVTGDLVAKHIEAEERERATGQVAGLLSGLPAPLGRWLVEGHGETNSRADRRMLLSAIEDRGIRLLEDEVAELRVGGATLAVVGLGLHTGEGEGSFVVGSEGTFVQEGPSEPSTYLNLVTPGSEKLRDYELRGELRFSSELSGAGLTFYNQMPQDRDRFYRLMRTPSKKEMHLSPHGTVFSTGRSAYREVSAPGIWYGFRIRVASAEGSTRVLARMWPADHPEPEGWVVDCTDATSTRLEEGTVGLWTSGPGRKEFRRLELTGAEGPVALEPGMGSGGKWSEPRAPDFILGVAERIPPGAFPLVLSHVPDVLPYAEAMGWPLVLAGHTQGGQVRLPFVGAVATDTALGRSFASGLFERGGTKLFISRGVGTTRIPFRLLAPPEITLITLRAGGGGAR